MTSEAAPTRARGAGLALIVVYAILAIAATGRSFVQILGKFHEAPLAYALSAVAAVVYIVATIALAKRGPVWTKVALAAVLFELVGVLVIGTISLVEPQLFPHDTVWSVFGRGYGFVPAILPFLGLWWIWHTQRAAATA